MRGARTSFSEYIPELHTESVNGDNRKM
ncbi:hypothetical protein CK3_10110 [butyrate-producing bacterium SS3/4]|nr:hypothetical protein CK3_10110 [butyrate-producing bacterium SS3/4]